MSFQDECKILLAELNQKGQCRSLTPRVHLENGQSEINHHTYWDFTTNDYLGLSQHSCLKQKTSEDISNVGMGSTGSRLLSGHHQVTQELESECCDFFSSPSVLVANSGYQINTGIIPTFYNKGDIILYDKKCHASLIDGIRLSQAKAIRFKHQDLEHLKTLIDKYRSSYKRCLIITESVFSMDGDITDIGALCDISKHAQSELLIDEAHAIGVYGPQGKGLTANYLDQITFVVGTFGKSFGSFGSFVLCSQEVRDVLINKCRSFLFSTALPLPVVLWNKHAIQYIKNMDIQRQTLLENVRWFRDQLQKKSYNPLGTSHIVPIIKKHNKAVISWSDQLKAKGIWCAPIRYPTVSKGTERLRFSITVHHSKEVLQHVLDAL